MSLLPERPKGDPGALRSAASTWQAAAGVLDGVGSRAGSHAGALAGWTGAGGGSFRASADDLAAKASSTAESCRSVACVLTRAAQQIEDAQRRHDLAEAAIATAVAVAASMAIETFGASLAEAAAVETAEATAMTAVIGLLDTALNSLAGQLAAAFVSNIAGSAVAGMMGGEGLGNVNPVSAAESALLGRGSTALLKGVGISGGLAFAGGKAATGFGNSTVVQQLNTGHVDPAKAGIGSAGSGAAAAGSK